MVRRTWRVDVGGEEHTVEVGRSVWTNAGHIRVDGEIVDSWGFRLWPEDRYFRIGRMSVAFNGTGLFPRGWRLYVDGKLITSGGGMGAAGCTTLRTRI